jgi:hypothetical protein
MADHVTATITAVEITYPKGIPRRCQLALATNMQLPGQRPSRYPHRRFE